jgi:hypothetical protein
MNCSTCQDIGIVKLNFQEGDEYGICLCPKGEEMRRSANSRHAVAPLWRVWAAQQQIDPSRIHPIEDVLTPAELTERGFAELTAPADALGAIAAAARARQGKQR